MLLMRISSQARMGALEHPAEGAALAEQALRVKTMSPDGGDFWPPIEALVARVYIAAKSHLDRVAELLNATLKNIDRQEKYRIAMDLVPEELRRRAEGRESASTARTVEEIRIDYLLAMGRATDARSLIEEAMARPSDPEFDRAAWLRRLANADAQQGREGEALANFQASLAGLTKSTLTLPQVQPMVSSARQ